MIIRKPEEGDGVRPGKETSPEQARMTYFWTWFNVLTMGLVDVATEGAVHHDEDEMRDAEASPELNMATLKSAHTCLLTMREAAYAFVYEDAKSGTKWSLKQGSKDQLVDVGLFFHCYPHCSVNSLHLHIVDLSETGPTYGACSHKNLRMNMVLKTLEMEIEDLEKRAKQKSAKQSWGALPRAA